MDNDAARQLKTIVERIEGRHAERRALDEDVKDIYSEAKGGGFDCKVIKAIVSNRRKDPKVLTEFESVQATYERALVQAGLQPVVKMAA